MIAPPNLEPGRDALFADIDGTLTPIAPTPGGVGPDPARDHLLAAVGAALGGRLAVISGRTLESVDRILEGVVPAVAGVHGLIRRRADGTVVEAAPDPRIGQAAAALRDFAATRPGLLVEDKGLAATLHYRGSPVHGPEVQRFAARLADNLGLIVQPGDHVAELRPAGATKGDALAAFMAEPPFAGARPVYVGDDLTDENGFAAARDLGGYGVVVGPRRPTAAAFALADPAAVLAWLGQVLRPS